jgi:plastocyanin
MKRWAIGSLVLMFAVMSLAFVAYAAEQATGEHKVPDQTVMKSPVKTIMIGPDRVSPSTANIAKGTTVVWVNTTSGGVSVFFSRGKEIAAVCAAPSRFALDADGNYNSGDIPQGGTASVCFLEAGKYEYQVVRGKTAGGAAKGTIVVK